MPNNVLIKLFNHAVKSACEYEDCHVVVKHDTLYFPDECTKDCECRKRIIKAAAQKTGYDINLEEYNDSKTNSAS